MAPRQDNALNLGNSRQYDEASSSPSLFGDDEKSNDDQLQPHRYNAWSHRFLYKYLEYVFRFDLESKSRKFYKIASWMMLTAFAILVSKRFDFRRKLAGDKTRGKNPNFLSNKINMIRYLSTFYGVLINLMRRPEYASAEQSSLGLLRTAAQRGGVQRALIGATEIFFSTHEGWKRSALPPQSPQLISNLMDLLTKNGCSEISTLPDSLWNKTATPILTVLPFVYLACAYRMLKGLQSGSLDGDDETFFSSKLLSRPTSVRKMMDENKVTFSDVAGLNNILPEVKEIVSYLLNPLGFHALGAEPPRGILLHGNPGVGKTMIARAIAGEADCDAFVVSSGSEFCEMYVGRGAGRVRALFRKTRDAALKNYRNRHGLGQSRWWPWSSTNEGRGDSRFHRPATAIIFIDELDAVAKSRSYSGGSNSNDERDQTLNQLLIEMDGFFQTNGTSSCIRNTNDKGNVTIIVIAATNRAETLDPAIMRRFDRQIHVPCPNKQGRMEILKVHAAKTRCRFSTIHWDYLAEETPNFSGSDLKQVVNDAALLAVRQQKKHIEQGHFLQSIQRARTMKVQNGIDRGSGYSPSSMLPFIYRP